MKPSPAFQLLPALRCAFLLAFGLLAAFAASPAQAQSAPQITTPLTDKTYYAGSGVVTEPVISLPIADADTTLTNFVNNATTGARITVAADNPNLIIPADLATAIGGTGGNRTLTLKHQAGITGIANVTITINDGTNQNTYTFKMTVLPAVSTTIPSIYNPGAQSTTEGTPLVFDNQSLEKMGALANAQGGQVLPVTYTLAVGFGTLSFNGVPLPTGLTLTGLGTRTITLTGEDAVINAYLANLTYTPDTGYMNAKADGTALASGAIVPDSMSISASTNLGTATGSFNIVVRAADNKPRILSAFSNRTYYVETGVATESAIPLPLADADTAATTFVNNATTGARITVTSDHPNLILPADMATAIGGTGSNRTLTLKHQANITGSANVTVLINDGTNQNSYTFTVTVVPTPNYYWGILAGSPAGTAGTANGTGTAATFNGPNGMVKDSQGNLFVSDYTNQVIRKITPQGVVTTFVGTAGSAGFSDGTGTAARINNALQMVIDANDNIYLADGGNHRIRRITPAGVITTIAGSGTAGSVNGAALSATFNVPSGIALDPATGALYVTEASGHLIRKIENGQVTTIAGLAATSGNTDGVGGAARFNQPHSLVRLADGNLLVKDATSGNYRVVNPVTAAVTTLTSGTANNSYSGVDAQGNLYLPLTSNQLTLVSSFDRVNLVGTGTAGSALGVNTAATIADPREMVFNADGSIYLVSRGQNNIRTGTPIVSLANPGKQVVVDTQLLTFTNPDKQRLAIQGNGAAEPLSLTLTVTKGTISLSQTTGLTFTAGDGTGDATMTFNGTVANINAALNNLVYDFDQVANPSTTSDTLTLTSPWISGNASGNVTQVVPITIGKAPVISAIANISVVTGNTLPTRAFTMVDGDNSPSQVLLTFTSSNTSLLPLSGIVLTPGTGASSTTAGATANYSLAFNTTAGTGGVSTVTMTATDSSGLSSTRTFSVTVVALAASTASTSNTTSTSSTLLGEVVSEGSSPVTQRGFVYALASVSEPKIGDAGVTQVVDSGSGLGSYSKLLSGLTPNTAYVFRAYAVNVQGTTYSSAQNFSTNLPPVITSHGGNTTVSLNVAENSTAVSTVSATDADAGQTITYSISGGADAARFAIGSTSGVVTFAAAPDFEAPADADANNVYTVIVQATDNGNTPKSATQTLTVTVTNVLDNGILAVEQPAGTALASGNGSVGFGNLTIGQSNERTFTLRSQGEAALLLPSGVVISGAAASDFSLVGSVPASLAIGGNSTFTVRFSPTGSGNRSATLSIPTNDTRPGGSPYTITLTGNGSATPTIATYTNAASQVLGGWVNGGNFTIGTVGTTSNSTNWPSAESPDKVVDANTGSKFLIFRNSNAGVILKPTNSSVVFNRLLLSTANDASERDPASFILYGSSSNLTGSAGTKIPISSLTPIASGNVTMLDARSAGPTVIQFANTVAYTSYVLVFPTLRNSATATSMQISEIQLSQGVNPPLAVAVADARGGQLSGGNFTFGSIGNSNPGTNWLAGESPDHAMDGNVNTKFTIFRSTGAGLLASPQAGAARMNSLTLWTANDAPERDPASYQIYGFPTRITQTSGTLAVGNGTLLANGTVTLPAARNSGPVQVEFNNSTPYASYLVVFPTVKNSPTSTNLTQFSELQFGYNGAPDFSLSQTVLSLNENSGPQTRAAFATGITAGLGDVGQTVSFACTNNNNALFSAQPAIAADGTLTFTTAPDAYGSAIVTVVATDNLGRASAPKTFRVEVAIVPSISRSATSLGNFTAAIGNASASQSFTINGRGLSGILTITAPTGFEISTDNSTFSSTLKWNRPAGTIQSVYRGAFGNYTTASGNIWYAGSGTEFPNGYAFAAITSNGSVVSWGNPAYGGNSTSVTGSLSSNVTAVYSTASAFAALKSNGSVVTWGDANNGGNSSVVAGSLSSNVTAVYSTERAFAALKSDGSVVSWGDVGYGGNSTAVSGNLSSNVTAVYSNRFAFAALKADGSVVTWGDAMSGGNSTAVSGNLSSNVTAVYSNRNAFAALKNNGSVVTWGLATFGGDSRSVGGSLTSNVTAVYSNTQAFAALKRDGSVVTWGDATFGGNSSSVSGNLSSNVTAVYSNFGAFAALKGDGSVVTWGRADVGGNSTSVSGNLSSNVTAVYSTAAAFAALKNDGSVVTWGDDSQGGNSSSVSGNLSSNVTAVSSNLLAFAALKSGGSVVTWGDAFSGGNSSSVAASLSSNVTAVYSSNSAFAALKKDGSVVTWGDARFGGSDGPANIGTADPLPATIYARLASTAPAGPVSGNLTLTSSGVGNQTVALSGIVSSVAAPTITASRASLTGFSATSGSASTSQSLTVNGSGLSSPVTLTAPAGFEISTDNSTFSSTLQLNKPGGTIQSVYRGAFGNYTTAWGNIWYAGSGTEFPNETAFAALKADGSVVTWGSATNGGNSTSVAGNLTSNVTAVYSSQQAFAALKADGSVVTWGSATNGGNSTSVAGNLTSNVTAVYSSMQAFAALKADGSVVTWGDANSGGNSTSVAGNLTSNVTAVYSTQYAFAALKANGSVVTWGDANNGGNSTSVAGNLTSNVTTVYSTQYAFAALKANGSVVTWGTDGAGGSSTSVAGSLSSNVTTVYSTGAAFAALKADGSLVTWGSANSGGDSTSVAGKLTSNVTAVYSTGGAFAALKKDGSVVTWGSSYFGGDSTAVAGNLTSNVTAVYSTAGAFAALKKDGSVVTWGFANWGGNSTSVAGNLSSNVTAVYSTKTAFAALKADGSVVTWGGANVGGSGGPANIGAGFPIPATIYTRLSSTAPAGSVSGNLTLTSTGAGNQTVALSGTVSSAASPTITASPASLTGFSATSGSASTSQSLTVNGSGLSSPVTLTAPAGFEISKDNASFSQSTTISPFAGNLSAVPVYVRIASTAPLGAVSGNITLTNPDSASRSVAVSGTVYKGLISTSLASLSGFATTQGTASAVQSFTVNGSGLSGLATLTAPTGFEISTDNSTFSSTLQLNKPGGTIQSVYRGAFGNYTTASGKIWSAGSGAEFPNQFAFAAITSNGSVVTWGRADTGGNSTSVAGTLTSNVTAVYSNLNAFAALKKDGSVVTWGFDSLGGNSTSVSGNLSSGVTSISSTTNAFAALKSDGSVVTWGFGGGGGNSTAVAGNLTSNVTAVYSAASAFAALKNNGSVVTWGDLLNGGNSTAVAGNLTSNVTAVYSTNSGFAALKSNGSVVTWGFNGGDSTAVAGNLTSNVTAVYSNLNAFAALKKDGSVVTWGSSSFGGDSTAVAGNLTSNVTAVNSTAGAFAALKSNGSVVTWGSSNFGGNSTAVAGSLTSNVTAVYSNYHAFAALKADGSLVVWGDATNGGDSTSVAGSLSSSVTAVYSTKTAFAALKADGSVVTWGGAATGGNSTAVSADLASGVTAVYSTETAFAALKADGSVVAWGNAAYGGSGGPANIGAGVPIPATIYTRLSSTAPAGSVSGNLTLTSSGVGNQTVALSGTVSSAASPTITASPVSLTGFSATSGSASTSQSFTVNGTALTANITITAPSNFQVSSDNSTFSSNLTLTRTGGNVTAAIVYARIASTASVGSVSGNITLASTGAGNQSVALSGTVSSVAAPTITASPTSLGNFTTATGNASAAQSFTVNGRGLSGPVTLTAPTGFEISADNLTFGSTLKVNNPGTIQSVYRGAFGNYTTASGNIWAAGSGKHFPNNRAFAAITSNGSVVTWGEDTYGGNSSSVAGSLSSNVTAVYSSDYAFAALKSNGSVVTWGDATGGGNSSSVAGSLSSNVTAVYSTENAFAALKSNGSVVTWGDALWGGNSSSVSGNLSSNVTAVYSTQNAFAALKSDGSVVTWGDATSGGNSSSVSGNLSSNVTAVYSNREAFAALKSNGSVVAWGVADSGGNSSSVAGNLSSNVTAVYSSAYAFAALKSNGSVVTWGDGFSGGNSSSVSGNLSSNVTAVYSNRYAFAALKSDGSVVTWGDGFSGGNSSSVSGNLSSNVTAVYSAEKAFAALKSDGSVVTWGDATYGGNSSSVSGSLSSNVTAVYSNARAFAALKSDRSVVTWGYDTYGGDSSSVSGNLSSNVTAVYSTISAFAALKSDGSVVTWGDENDGGSGGPANIGAAGTLPATVYVRIAQTAPLGSVAGNITLTNRDAAPQSVAVSGLVQEAVVLPAFSGNNTISTNFTMTGGYAIRLKLGVDYLIVGGGGSGGTPGGDGLLGDQDTWGTGGGGGGGMLSGNITELVAGNYSVTVGAGGTAPGYSAGSTSRGNNGGNSTFGTFTAIGGGGGGGGKNSFSGVGANGGSGGGGGSKSSNAGGNGTVGQGNAGGNARDGNSGTFSPANNRTAGGGGGGAGQAGFTPASGSSVGGRGGNGTASSITGSSVIYAGGGGGGARDKNSSGEGAGVGGAGGGGNGSTQGNANAGTNGLGGGGGGRGAGGTGGNGGSGVVIVRYLGAPVATGGNITAGSGNATGYTLHTFSTPGDATFGLTGENMQAIDAILTGNISGSGGLSFNGPGTLVLAGTNSFSGSTVISSGTVQLGNGGTTGSVPGPIVNNGVLAIDRSDNFTLSSGVSGGGAVLKLGNNTLTVASSVQGPVSVDAGTLFVTGSTGAVTVKSGATLAGNGTTGSATLESGGNLSPGNGGIGTLSTGSLSLAGGSTWNWKTNSTNGTAGVNSGLVESTGALTIGATAGNRVAFNISALGNFSLTGVKQASWTVGRFPGGITGFSASAFAINTGGLVIPAGGQFTLALDGNNTLVLRYQTPHILASVTALENFTAAPGTASAVQSFIVNGALLQGAITLTAPTGFEISTDNSTFSSSLRVNNPGTIQSVYRGAFGNYTTASGKIWSAGSGAEFPNKFAFAALKADGSVATWGLDGFGGNSTSVAGNLSSNVTAVYSTGSAFAALKTNGSVITWGDANYGGDSTSVAGSLSSNVTAVYSNQFAFAALKADGSVVTWGSASAGGNSTSVAGSLSSNVTAVYSNTSAFAALKANGSVVTWGDASFGGNSTSVAGNLTSNVTSISSTSNAFAALKTNGSVITWGDANTGGNSTSVAGSLSSNVTAVYSNQFAFAALKANGSVVTWGFDAAGGDSTSVAGNLSSNVTAVYSTGSAFAALKADGSVVTWGSATVGGNSTSVAGSLSSNVTAVYSSIRAFAALKANGSVVTWGDANSGGNSTSVAGNLTSNVTTVYSTGAAFAALKADGSLVTWGSANSGGNSTSVAGNLTSNVTAVYSTQTAFAALKADGSVVTWGDTNYGGTGGPANIGEKVPIPTSVYARLSPTAPLGPVSGNLTLTSPGMENQTVALSGTVSSAASPTITASPASLTGFSVTSGSASASQSFTVNGTALTANITITAPSNFQVSSDNSTFSSNLTLTRTGGNVTAAIVYARIASTASVGSVSGNITLASTGAGNQSVALSGIVSSVTVPTITASPTSLGNFTTKLGSASTALPFLVGGTVLTANITITAPAGFEISSTGSAPFASSLSLAPSSGTVASTSVYARLAANATAGAKSGNITLASTGATSRQVAVSGTVTLPYEDWAGYWSTQNGSFSGAAALGSADSDSDGYSNTTEFAFGGNPLLPTASLISVAPTGGNITITFLARVGNSTVWTGGNATGNGLNYQIQSSGNLTLGFGPASGISNITPAADQTGIQAADFPYVRWQFQAPISGQMQYYRVRTQNATTDPVGYLKINMTAGTGSAKRVSLISAPLLDTATINGSVAGRLTGVTSTTLSCSSANWTAGALSQAATPFLIQMTSGNATGHTLLISTTANNTASTVTINAEDVTSANGDIASLGIAVGDSFKIVPCDTLLSFLGTPATTAIRGNGTADRADTVIMTANGVSQTYFYHSTLARWTQNASGFADSSNVPIRPNAGIQYARLGQTPLSLTVIGNVPTIARKAPVINSGVTSLATFFPSNATLASLGLRNLSNWTTGPSAAVADTVTIISDGLSSTYYHNGTNWVKNAFGNPVSNSLVIPAGASILINQRGSAPQSSIFSQPLPYTP